VTLAAEYRDGPASVDNGDCEPLWVIPATWRIALPDGTLMVANAGSVPMLSKSGGLVTCRGQLDAAQPVLVRAP
jgi:hypothetical protein